MDEEMRQQPTANLIPFCVYNPLRHMSSNTKTERKKNNLFHVSTEAGNVHEDFCSPGQWTTLNNPVTSEGMSCWASDDCYRRKRSLSSFPEKKKGTKKIRDEKLATMRCKEIGLAVSFRDEVVPRSDDKKKTRVPLKTRFSLRSQCLILYTYINSRLIKFAKRDLSNFRKSRPFLLALEE